MRLRWFYFVLTYTTAAKKNNIEDRDRQTTEIDERKRDNKSSWNGLLHLGRIRLQIFCRSHYRLQSWGSSAVCSVKEKISKSPS